MVHLGAVDRDEAEKQDARANAKVPGSRNANRILYVYGQDKPGYDRIGLTPAEISYLKSLMQAVDV